MTLFDILKPLSNEAKCALLNSDDFHHEDKPCNIGVITYCDIKNVDVWERWLYLSFWGLMGFIILFFSLFLFFFLFYLIFTVKAEDFVDAISSFWGWLGVIEGIFVLFMIYLAWDGFYYKLKSVVYNDYNTIYFVGTEGTARYKYNKGQFVEKKELQFSSVSYVLKEEKSVSNILWLSFFALHRNDSALLLTYEMFGQAPAPRQIGDVHFFSFSKEVLAQYTNYMVHKLGEEKSYEIAFPKIFKKDGDYLFSSYIMVKKEMLTFVTIDSVTFSRFDIQKIEKEESGVKMEVWTNQGNMSTYKLRYMSTYKLRYDEIANLDLLYLLLA